MYIEKGTSIRYSSPGGQEGRRVLRSCVLEYKYLSVLVIPWESTSSLCKDFFWEGRNRVAFPFLSFFFFL